MRAHLRMERQVHQVLSNTRGLWRTRGRPYTCQGRARGGIKALRTQVLHQRVRLMHAHRGDPVMTHTRLRANQGRVRP